MVYGFSEGSADAGTILKTWPSGLRKGTQLGKSLAVMLYQSLDVG